MFLWLYHQCFLSQHTACSPVFFSGKLYFIYPDSEKAVVLRPKCLFIFILSLRIHNERHFCIFFLEVAKLIFIF